MVLWRMGRWRDPLRGPVPASDEGGGRHSGSTTVVLSALFVEELSSCVGRSEVERCTGGGSDEVVISPSLLVSEYCIQQCTTC